MKKKNIIFSLLILISQIGFSQSLFIPNGSSGIGSSSTSNVGIGISSPLRKLAVNGGIDIYGESLETDLVGLIIYRPTENGIQKTRWGLMADISNNSSYPFLTNRTPFGKVVIKTGSASGGSEFTHFTIEGGDGIVKSYFENVMLGIGEKSPDAALHIYEDVNGTGSTLWIDADTNVNPNIMFGTNGQRSANIRVKDSENDQLQFQVGPNLIDAMSIDTEGNVGIGNTNPTEKLVVDGKILAEEIQVQTVPASDYVFEPDYDLKPIEEVASFIKENKHLPDIPSAEEFKENGVGLGEMDNMLLRKVEELTLYMIDMQIQVDRLKAENELLKQKIRD